MGYSAIAAKQGRMLGTVRPVSAGIGESSLDKRLVFNVYNRHIHPLFKVEATNSWVYNATAYRVANGNNNNNLQIVVGLPNVELYLYVSFLYSSDTFPQGLFGSIGEDSTTQSATRILGQENLLVAPQAGANYAVAWAKLVKYAPLGFHTYYWLEYTNATGIHSCYGDNGDSNLLQNGIAGWIIE